MGLFWKRGADFSMRLIEQYDPRPWSVLEQDTEPQHSSQSSVLCVWMVYSLILIAICVNY